ncbi:class I SAM-dependent methyltransferase [Rhizobium sp. KVB221]|uniref:Class I SAM-dependent methyltransferase n=1 Tax=Rhizobium setariae TaxID=2801340 RepID=A0A936YNM1_9HYPH|nr:class I SAM-dependent methyltransferase [Rhizobium setariae]MBL0373795.1 class I SAM-dependent methyltransferase [Rhizobium setariae]
MEQTAYREMAATEQAHWWFLARRKIIADTIKSFNLPPHSKILEVGAGTGGNLKLLQRFGDLSAVEMDDYARAYATQVSGVGVEYGLLPNSLPTFPHNFQLICMFDVLEHVEKDFESLKVLATRLNPGGRILITVPAYPWMWTDHDAVLHHHRRYTRTTLSNVINRAGLQLDRLTNFNTLLFPAAIAARLVGNALGKKGSPGSSLPPRFVNSAFETIFKSEAPMLRRLNLPFGLSLMAVASNYA